MTGKRRWPAVLALFAAAALVMLPTSRGVDSPRTEPLAAAVEAAEPLPAAEPEGKEDLPAEESLPPEPPKPPEPAQPVPQTPVVADTYFDEAVFFGDSRTDGFRLYSGLDRGSYYVATGATVEVGSITKAAAVNSPSTAGHRPFPAMSSPPLFLSYFHYKGKGEKSRNKSAKNSIKITTKFCPGF